MDKHQKVGIAYEIVFDHRPRWFLKIQVNVTEYITASVKTKGREDVGSVTVMSKWKEGQPTFNHYKRVDNYIFTIYRPTVK